MTEYDASQKQRYMERQVRKWKREQLALEAAGQDSGEASKKIREWQGQLRDFTDQTGLKRQSAREQVAGFGRSQAARATQKAKKELEKYTAFHYNKNGTIVVTDDWRDIKHPSVKKRYKPYAVVDTVSRGGKQRDRTVYDENGLLAIQVHGGDHGHPKEHPFGNHGEHVHDFSWPDGQEKPQKTTRDARDSERIVHKDILGGEEDDG